jgi:hypothetical protein
VSVRAVFFILLFLVFLLPLPGSSSSLHLPRVLLLSPLLVLLLVASLEESLRALTFDAAANPTDNVATTNTEGESVVQLLESRNIVRPLDISRKRRLGPRASRIKLAAAATDAEDGD